MFVLSRPFVQSLNILRDKDKASERSEQVSMSGNEPCYLTVHEVCCHPVSDEGSFPTLFYVLLGSSNTIKACLAEW